MVTKQSRKNTRLQRVRRVRAKISGTVARPRLVVFRSLSHISAQLIDDSTGRTLVAASDKGLTDNTMIKAEAVGREIAERAKKHKINQVVFDRAGYQYHGRVAALAKGAREAGLTF